MRRRHVMPFGAQAGESGVRFAFWAPSAEKVALVLDGSELPMPEAGNGWRELVVPDATADARYSFRVDGAVVPDPASRFQPEDVKGPSLVVDPHAYHWSDADWAGRPWEEAVIYEVHVGTATPAGTFGAFAGTLPELRDLGVTAIELMPLADFAGRRNWGYDGVLPYAPDSAYGTPEDLKRLVDQAHSLGMMVILDVVYNHFGPVGNHLSKYAKSFFTERHKTPWGAGLNFDGRDGRPVREFFVHNALYWIEEFHVDGLRFDAVHAILDDSDRNIIAELAERVRAAVPDRHVHLILENERNQASWLERDEAMRPNLHTAQWNDDIHHCWHVLLTGEAEAYYADFADDPVGRLGRCLAEGFAYQGEPSRHADGRVRGEPSGHLPPSAFVAFLQNHDQVGNRAFGDRLGEGVPADRMTLARAGLLLSPQIPMLFMGEEWAASTPFQFFVDFSDDEDLSRAVRDGRRREFQHFAAFQDSDAAASVPDPTDEATFRRSVLDRSEARRAPHAAVLEEVRRLIAIRRDHVVGLTRTPFRSAEYRQPTPSSLDVTWTYEGGTMRFAANFGDGDLAIPSGDRAVTIWHSPALDDAAPELVLPPWTGLFTMESRG